MRSAPLYSLIEKTKLLFPSLTKLLKKLHSVVNSFPVLHRKLLPLLVLAVAILLLLPSTNTSDNAESQTGARKTIELTITPPTNIATNSSAGNLSSSNAPTDQPKPVQIKNLDPENITGDWRAHVIRKGDSVYRIFRQYNIPSPVLHALIAIESQEQYITKVTPGQIMSFYISKQGELVQLRITGMDQAAVTFMRREDGSYIRQDG